MTDGQGNANHDGSSTSVRMTILGVGAWLIFLIAWNAMATDSAPTAKAVAILSAVVFSSVATVSARLRKVAFTAWVLTCVLIAFCYPQTFIHWGDFQLKTLIVPLIQLIMFGMGATLTLADFTRVLKMPRAVLIGILLQFSIMPLLGFALAMAFGFEPSVAAGVVLIGSCPGGVASNVMTYLSKGNVALSVTMTACSTLLSPVLTPLLMYMLAGTLVEIVFLDWVINITKIIIVPISIGLIFNSVLRALDRRGAWIDRFLSWIAMFGICFIIGIIIADSRDKLLTIGIALVAASILHNAAGYVLGYFGARLVKLDESSCRTVAIEVGLQNGGMATALAINTLKDPLAALAPAIFGPWMNISGSMLASWWAARPPTSEKID
ncbi:bile acid:sodium symporter family protein [Roseimaritima ulvae]|uniref:Sodium Bile acid symporter family protein n=1 Tax=Roseimaritima ulvae TaxID=980254 RepID=A0A5B9QKC2_9BACT|nr:bile acid:sodium symporter family protein [Roseimaritima ulvae]QEG38182.1 Sodium Bile acid symporter family protein [Roseimaritima ulvae]